MAEQRLGVVVMAYGTPGSRPEIEAYYTHIRRGRPPSAEQLADLTARYEAIGGTSALAERTEAQRVALASALGERAPGRCVVVLGQKHSSPFVEDAAATLADQGAASVVGLVLAPHFARSSVGEYRDRLVAAAREPGLPVSVIESWHMEPTYIAFLGRAVRQALTSLPAATHVIFTAHSLPEKALVGDPYPEQLRSSAAAAARAAGLEASRWSLGWQSAARTPEPWRGPDVLVMIRDLAGRGDLDSVLVCPQGFVSDHLEVAYDLDIEARRVAGEVGLAFGRTAVLNDDAAVIGSLADRVLEAAP